MQQSHIVATHVAGRDQIIHQHLLGSVDYQELVQEIKDAKELLAGIAPEKTALRLKQSAKVEELQQRLEGVIKSAVFDTLRRFFYIIPIRFPVPVCTINSQRKHDPGIFRCPPCTGYFQTLLNNVPMRTLYFA